MGIVYTTRMNEYAPFGDFVNCPDDILCDLCYIVLRKKCTVTERNTVCATILFHVKSVAWFTGFINYVLYCLRL